MNRRFVGTAVGGRSILCVVLIISYHEAIGQPTFHAQKLRVPEINSTLRIDMHLDLQSVSIFNFLKPPQKLRACAPYALCLCMSLAESI